MEEIVARLLSQRDADYREFHCKLIPNIDPVRVIGVRMPQLQALAKELHGTAQEAVFLAELPHRYYEEQNLQALLIGNIREISACMEALDRFLPFVDNWATCDSLRPKCFAKNKEVLWEKIPQWLSSSHPYTVRFGIEMLMLHFLEGAHREEALALAARAYQDEYYVNMMLAWFYATALAKCWDSTIKYLEGARLSPWIHNKTIQKAMESYRITPEQKQYLRRLKRS